VTGGVVPTTSSPALTDGALLELQSFRILQLSTVTSVAQISRSSGSDNVMDGLIGGTSAPLLNNAMFPW
jgi:hypothetical protein